MSAKLRLIQAKVRGGAQITFEEAADLFELTTYGRATMHHSRLSRADILALLRQRFPDEESLTENIARSYAVFERLGKPEH
jgi:hypothetical protein